MPSLRLSTWQVLVTGGGVNQRSAPERTASMIPGRRVVSPCPHTMRGRTMTVAVASSLPSATSFSASALD